MRHVKKDYEVCAVSYQSTMAKIGQVATTSSTTTPAPPVLLHQPTPIAAMSLSVNDMQNQNQQHHHHRQHHNQHQQQNLTKSVEDAEEERLKMVCW